MTDTTPVATEGDEEPKMSHDKAAEVVENDEALQEAGADSEPADENDAS